MNLNPIGAIIEAVGEIADDLFTSDEERIKAAIEMRKLGIEEMRIDAELAQGQIEVNKAEAQHPSLFVSGWRPAVGWVCVLALSYQFLLYPMMTWAWAYMQALDWIPVRVGEMELTPPPMLDTGALYTVLLGILGLGTMRSVEKAKGVARTGWGK